MGFFTDADKKAESQHSSQFYASRASSNPLKLIVDHPFFNGFSDRNLNSETNSNFSFVSQGSSIQKVCKNDPNDENYMICTVKERKLTSENGENKWITEEREEREPIGSNHSFFHFPIFSQSQKRRSGQNDDPYKEFEESQRFFDFFPKMINYFRGESNRNENKDALENRRKRADFDPFFDMNAIFPSIFFNSSWFNDDFFEDPFFQSTQARFSNGNDFYRNGGLHNRFNAGFNNQGMNQNSQKRNQNFNSNYSYPGSRGSKNDSEDIYDL